MRETDLPQHLRIALGDYAERLRRGLGTRLHDLKLFGSWAQGRARPHSDIDVWVLVDTLDTTSRSLPFEAAEATLLEHGVNLAATVKMSTSGNSCAGASGASPSTSNARGSRFEPHQPASCGSGWTARGWSRSNTDRRGLTVEN